MLTINGSGDSMAFITIGMADSNSSIVISCKYRLSWSPRSSAAFFVCTMSWEPAMPTEYNFASLHTAARIELSRPPEMR